MQTAGGACLRLVADIGGTTARMGLARDGMLCADSVKSFANDDWSSLYAVAGAYLREHAVQPCEMVIAVAGPVSNNQARLTNRDWMIETAQLKTLFHCDKIHLLNDLNALGYAVSGLKQSQLRQVRMGSARHAQRAQSLVVGVGTGFNVSPVLMKSGMVHCLAVEAGHVTLPFGVTQEMGRLGGDVHGFETIEDLFSGRGFTRFCQQITGDGGLEGRAAISSYGAEDARASTSAVNLYAKLLGRLIGDLSMAYMPTSGLYLAGSVARAVLDVAQDICIAEISQPRPIRADFDPPIWTIEDDTAALIGCKSYVFA